MVCIRIDINEADINQVVLLMGLECSFCHGGAQEVIFLGIFISLESQC